MTPEPTVTMPRALYERALVASQAPDVIPHDPTLAGDLVALLLAQPQGQVPDAATSWKEATGIMAERAQELERAIREHQLSGDQYKNDKLYGNLTPRRRMKTCDTCRHWGDASVGGLLRCCDHAEPNEGADATEDMGIVVVQYPPEQSSLMTGPKFGCVHWEPIENPQPGGRVL